MNNLHQAHRTSGKSTERSRRAMVDELMTQLMPGSSRMACAECSRLATLLSEAERGHALLLSEGIASFQGDDSDTTDLGSRLKLAFTIKEASTLRIQIAHHQATHNGKASDGVASLRNVQRDSA
jgi:hypothetical protein